MKHGRESMGVTGRAQEMPSSFTEVVGNETVEQLLAKLPPQAGNDTASALVEIYESVERSYRAAIMAGEAHPRVTHSTNY
jgi:hypothetical protein